MKTILKGRYSITLDDDPNIHRIIQKVMGIKSIPFLTPEELLAKANRYKPIAAFIDVHLDKFQSGLELLSFLRTQWPYCPLIVVTSDASEAIISEALASGADDFIRKPIQPTELRARLQTRLDDMATKRARSLVRTGDISVDLNRRILKGMASRPTSLQAE